MTDKYRIAYVNRVVSVIGSTPRVVFVRNGEVLLIICAAHMLKPEGRGALLHKILWQILDGKNT